MVRQHVNPLTEKYQQSIDIPDWSKLYQNLENPMLIDIGCAKGNYLIDLAKKNKDKNYLGLEIREPLVSLANSRVEELNNIHFFFCNANVDFISIYQSLKDYVDQVAILNPDPWFKEKHKKRRLVNETFVNELYDNLNADVKLYIQSDVLELFEDIEHKLENYFQKVTDDFYIISDREKAVLSRNENMYKQVYTKII
jgi:tRNA (guanine-N7-)-methyltransferase